MLFPRRGQHVAVRSSNGPELPATIVDIRHRSRGRTVLIRFDEGFDLSGHVHVKTHPHALRRLSS